MTVTSTMSGPGDRVMLPPARVTRRLGRELEQPVEQAVDVADVRLDRKHQRQQRKPRSGRPSTRRR